MSLRSSPRRSAISLIDNCTSCFSSASRRAFHGLAYSSAGFSLDKIPALAFGVIEGRSQFAARRAPRTRFLVISSTLPGTSKCPLTGIRPILPIPTRASPPLFHPACMNSSALFSRPRRTCRRGKECSIFSPASASQRRPPPACASSNKRCRSCPRGSAYEGARIFALHWPRG